MSDYSEAEVPTVLLIDPKLVPQAPTRVIRRGATQVEYNLVPANGGAAWGQGSVVLDGTTTPVAVNGASNHQFQIDISEDQLLARRIDLRLENVYVTLKVTKATATASLNTRPINAGCDSLKSFPINRSIENCTLKLNGEAISTNINQNLQVYLQTVDESILQCSDNSLTPSYLDNVQSYADLCPINAVGVDLAPLNPLGVGNRTRPGRGAFPGSIIVNQAIDTSAATDTAYATVFFPVIEEPLFVPCLW